MWPYCKSGCVKLIYIFDVFDMSKYLHKTGISINSGTSNFLD
jgi:hypothetical protein